MKSSIRITHNGNRIRFTGDAANEFFKSMVAATEKKEVKPQEQTKQSETITPETRK
jgi:hypothetical protein